MTPVTLSRHSDGNRIDSLLDQPTYDDLLRRAASILHREAQGHLFEPADLVHDAFLRITHSSGPVRIQSAGHLLALATVVMRRVLIDDSRSPKSPIHVRSVPLNSQNLTTEPSTNAELVRDALARLADYEDHLFQIVEMRFFGGFDMQEIACALDVSSRTVKRKWSVAREHLHTLLSS